MQKQAIYNKKFKAAKYVAQNHAFQFHFTVQTKYL